MYSTRLCSLTLVSFAVAACGGGSPSASPPPVVDPPFVSFDTSQATVLSGATRVFGLRGTLDGLDTAPNVSCTDNIAVAIPLFVFEFKMPDVSVLTEASCTASLTNSAGETRTDTMAFTILPRTDIGQVVGIFDPHLKLVRGDYTRPLEEPFSGPEVIGIVELPDGTFRLKGIGGGSNSTWPALHRNDIVTIEATFDAIDFLEAPSLRAHGLPSASLSVTSSTENAIYWYTKDANANNFSVRAVIEGINQPCHLFGTDTQFGRDLVVGSVNTGLVILDLEVDPSTSVPESFTTTPIQYLGAGRSYCHVKRGPLPLQFDNLLPRGVPRPSSGPYYSKPLWAIDYDALEIVYYGDVNNNNTLSELGVIPIATNATGKLEIVQVISTGTSSSGDNYVLLMLSDGNHIGEHRLIMVGTQDGLGEQVILHEWSEGVPVSMLHANVGGSLAGRNFRPDLVVVLGTVEDSLFFDNLRPVGDEIDNPLYGEPTTFKVGIGAGSAIAARRPWPTDDPNAPDGGVLVSYPETGEIVYISP